MNTFVVLLRGINVGGNNKLPMKVLTELLAANNYKNISTYIQTGNIVLTTEQNIELNELSNNLSTLITSHFGFNVNVFACSKNDFITAANNNPYQEREGKSVHFYFCQNAIELAQDKLDKWIAASETYQVVNNVFYLYAPDDIGRSKLIKNIEPCLTQTATGRNLNTINKLLNMLGVE